MSLMSHYRFHGVGCHITEYVRALVFLAKMQIGTRWKALVLPIATAQVPLGEEVRAGRKTRKTEIEESRPDKSS